MDNTRKLEDRAFRETRFRQPTQFERELGVWVDRIGEAAAGGPWPRWRILGQHAVVLVEEGCGRVETQGAGAADVQTDDVIVVWPETPTRYNGKGPWRTRWIVWNGPEANLWCRALNWPSLCIRQGALPVQRAYQRLAGWMANGDAGAAFHRKSMLMEMVTGLSEASERRVMEDGAVSRVRGTVAAMVERCEQHWTVPDLARVAGLSPSQYRRVFSACTGTSPTDFLRSCRVARAKGLLLSGVPIKDVAVRTGYPDVFYFMRTFRRVAGMPPGRFARLGGWAGEPLR